MHGAADSASFLAVGEQCSHDLQAALALVGRSLDSFAAILDFGCGCGRTIRFLAPQLGAANIYGTDIDREAVTWCRANVPGAYLVNDALPPIGYQAASFDLIYAISVFTHLDEVIQFNWLHELQRLTRPGGLVVLTTHGETHIRDLPDTMRSTLLERGFLYVASDGWRNIFPQWYQDSFHTQAYVAQQFQRYFEVRTIIPAGMNHRQDIVILQRRAEDGLPAAPPLPAWARVVQLEREAAALHRTVKRKDAHIQRLEQLLDQIAQGRVMRLLNRLHLET